MHIIPEIKSQKLFSWYVMFKDQKSGNQRFLAPTGGFFMKDKAASG